MGLRLEGICGNCEHKNKCIDSYNEAFSEKFSGVLKVSTCEFHKKKEENK